MYKNLDDKEKFWQDLKTPAKSCGTCTRPGFYSPERYSYHDFGNVNGSAFCGRCKSAHVSEQHGEYSYWKWNGKDDTDDDEPLPVFP